MQHALASGASRCLSSEVTRYVHQFISCLINLSARFASTQRPSALSSFTYLTDSKHFSSFNPVCSCRNGGLFGASSHRWALNGENFWRELLVQLLLLWCIFKQGQVYTFRSRVQDLCLPFPAAAETFRILLISRSDDFKSVFLPNLNKFPSTLRTAWPRLRSRFQFKPVFG